MQTSNASSDANDDVGAVWWIVSKVGSGSESEIQVVIADDGDGLSAKLVAYDVRHLIEKGISSSFTINQSINPSLFHSRNLLGEHAPPKDFYILACI